MYNKLMNCLASVRKFTDFEPEVALILGSGLGDFADNKVKVEAKVSYADIEGFPQSTVSGHAGQFVFGYVGDVKVVVMQGRVHYYEGYQMSDVVLPTRLMKMMGAKKLFLTNAAGGCNPEYQPGDLMIISDHISSFVPSPLIGKNIDEFGVRFPGMSEVYSKRLRSLVKEKAAELGVKVQEGVYVQFTGPNYETPSEVQLVQAESLRGMHSTLSAERHQYALRFSTLIGAYYRLTCSKKAVTGSAYRHIRSTIIGYHHRQFPFGG